VWRSPAGIPRISVEFRLERDLYLAMPPRVPVRIEHFELVRHAFPHQRSLDIGLGVAPAMQSAPTTPVAMGL